MLKKPSKVNELGRIFGHAMFIISLLLALFSVEATALGKKQFKEWGRSYVDDAEKEILGLKNRTNQCKYSLGFYYGTHDLITVRPHLYKQGLKDSDTVISIDGINFEPESENGKNSYDYLQLLSVKKGDNLNWVVERNGERLTISVVCQNSQLEYWNAIKDVGAEMRKDRPKKCIEAINKHKKVLMNTGMYWHLLTRCYARGEKRRVFNMNDFNAFIFRRSLSELLDDMYKLNYSISEEYTRTKLTEIEANIEVMFPNDPWRRDNLLKAFSKEKAKLIGSSNQQQQSLPPNQALHIPQLVSSGSGFVISEKGYIATNYHVVEGCTAIKLDDEKLKTIAVDKTNDLAILQSKKSFREYAHISKSSPKLSDRVIVYGYPLVSLLGENLSATSGEISSLSGFKGDYSQFTISAPIQPGNSGGPIVNENNEVVGVVVSTLDNVALASEKGIVTQNVNFGIRVSLLLNILSAYGISLPDTKKGSQTNFQKTTKLLACYK
jgi:S1-C subfamily serine protease